MSSLSTISGQYLLPYYWFLLSAVCLQYGSGLCSKTVNSLKEAADNKSSRGGAVSTEGCKITPQIHNSSKHVRKSVVLLFLLQIYPTLWHGWAKHMYVFIVYVEHCTFSLLQVFLTALSDHSRQTGGHLLVISMQGPPGMLEYTTILTPWPAA